MNINRKYIIIFGTLILLLVIITGAITYYKEKEAQIQLPIQLSGVNRNIVSFSQDYPASPGELVNFISSSKNAVFSDIEELKDNEGKGIREVGSLIVDASLLDIIKSSPNTYTFSNPFILASWSLKSFSSFKTGQYFGISINLKDVVKNHDASLLEEEKLYFCSISEPSWTDPFYLQMEPKMDLIFDDGDVCCSGIKMDKTPSINFSGFIPQAESLNIKQYLVDEQAVSDVMNKQSFSEIKEILEDYPIIWQMEKPIIP